MIEELKAYSNFKPIGLPWLERIPTHWSLVPNRALVRRRKQLVGRSHHRYTLLSLTKQGIIVRDVASGKGKFSSDMGTSQEVRYGDLVFCFFDVPETPRTVGLSSHHGMITGAYTVLEPLQPGIAPYFELFYRAMDDSKLLSPLYSGLRNTIPVDRFLETKTPVPPPEEQAAIVRFLDHANRRVDQFIRLKKRLIALLNEQKQAIIHRAVTRGLDPNVTLRDSGIAWLGEIPDHWDVRRFKMIATINSGQVDPRRSQYRGMALVAPNHIEKATGRLLKTETTQEQGAISGKYFVRKGQVIYSKIRPALQKATVAPFDCLCSADMYAIDTRSSTVTPPFLLLLLLSRPFSQYTIDASLRVAMPKVNQDALGVCPLWLPPRQEQDQIVAFVQETSAPLDCAIASAEREIALIQEYRARLVADVVTGQLDVRAAATSLPELAPDSVPDEATADEGTEFDDNEAA